ncbi:MAG: ABC transporter substrate-binding protein [Dehalococcoidales bacterium]|nr:ABC transporter substrate-binding protein [Dehalococcoidales bacterium]
MKKVFIFLTTMLIFILVMTGCGDNPTTTTTTTSSPTPTASTTSTTAAGPKYGGTLRIIYDSGPSGAIGYPQDLMSDSTTAPQLCLEGLLKEDNKNQFTPWLAESYQLADDRLSITLMLKKGVQFHDGSNLNAEVCKWNLENSITAKRAPYWTSVEIIDEYTVKVNFSVWYNTMLSGFSGNTAWMISKEAFDKNGLEWVRQNPVGTGPFKFESYLKDTHFKVTKNPNYWKKADNGDQLPYLDAVTMLFIADTVTQTSAMQTGEAEMLTIKHGSKVAADLSSLGFVIQSAAIDTSVIFGDTANPDSPWANKKVREAAEYAIDRDAIATMGYGYWKPAYQVPGSSTTPYDPNFSLGRNYDVEKAKQLLTEAGYPEGFATTLVAAPVSLNKDVVVALQGYLSKVGIQAEIQYPDAGKFTTDYMMGTWNNAIIYQPVAGFANYMNIFSILFSPVTNWHPSWEKTPAYVEAYTAALSAPSPDIELIRAVTDLITNEALMTPINEGGRGWAYSSYVKDAGILETSLPPFLKLEQAWLDK